MRVLVLNRFGLSAIRYAEWLDGCSEVVLITSSRSLSDDPEVKREQTRGYAEVVEFDDYLDNPLVVHEAARLHDKYRFDRLIAMSEYDILRGAQLRDLLGIPGLGTADAVAFRDKAEMKRLLTLGGIPVARHAAVYSATDVLAFVREHGYPIVVKPRRGAGSVGVEIVRDEAELASMLARVPTLRGDADAGLIMEEYIEHELFQVDGVMCRGKVELSWPSQSSSTLVYLDGGAHVTTMLAADDPLRAPLQELAHSALTALPTPPVTIFHIEVFRHHERGLILNEVAARMAGGKTDANMERAFGVNLEEWYVRSVLPERSYPIPSAVPTWACASALFTARPGVLVAAPTSCPIDGVVGYRLTKTVGETLAASVSAVDFMAWMTVATPAGQDVRPVLDQGVRWFNDSVRVEQQV